MTSHSPAVLSRVNPSEVRYCRCDPKTRVYDHQEDQAAVGDDDEASQIRARRHAGLSRTLFRALRALVEGDSERIVLPRLAEALNLLIDPAFVAIVPLGGRHVQHFWRLLAHSNIPYATLLDLDLGREGGGFGRIKTAIENLIGVGASKKDLLGTDKGMLTDEEFAAMYTWQDAEDRKNLSGWIDCLKKYRVYFSEPLDLDLAMLAAFPAAYKATIPTGGGPRMAADKAAKQCLGRAALD